MGSTQEVSMTTRIPRWLTIAGLSLLPATALAAAAAQAQGLCPLSMCGWLFGCGG